MQRIKILKEAARTKFNIVQWILNLETLESSPSFSLLIH
jgi:hypothetical protein